MTRVRRWGEGEDEGLAECGGAWRAQVDGVQGRESQGGDRVGIEGRSVTIGEKGRLVIDAECTIATDHVNGDGQVFTVVNGKLLNRWLSE